MNVSGGNNSAQFLPLRPAFSACSMKLPQHCQPEAVDCETDMSIQHSRCVFNTAEDETCHVEVLEDQPGSAHVPGGRLDVPHTYRVLIGRVLRVPLHLSCCSALFSTGNRCKAITMQMLTKAWPHLLLGALHVSIAVV